MQFDKGVYTVIPTIFTADNNVDINSILNLVKFQVESGVKNLVLLGTTSETPTLKIEERLFIVNTIWEKFKEEVNKVYFSDCCSCSSGCAGSGFSVLRPAICETRMLIS